MNQKKIEREYSSYKDPDGYVFYQDNKVFRKVNTNFSDHYHSLKKSGIYKVLIDQKLLIPFTDLQNEEGLFLETEKIQVITYPYEWGFEQLKAAALLHLEIMEICLNNKAILKDASPFNIQFYKNKPCFIDVLSIEIYESGTPWNAYKQFCEFFLAPLLLSNYFPGNWNKQLAIHLEGIPLKEVAALLPYKARFNSLSLMHIIAHSKFTAKNEGPKKTATITKEKTLSIIKHLKLGISELTAKDQSSNWTSYEGQVPYSANEFSDKKTVIEKWIANRKYETVLDIGANHDLFATLFFDKAENIIAIDNDCAVVDKLYKKQKKPTANFIPLNADITMVSPSLGINLKERSNFFSRIKPDMTIALAVVHHIFQRRNIPLNYIADIFSTFSKELIIEFVSEEDEQFIKIQNPNNKWVYNKQSFEEAFSVYFNLHEMVEIKKGKRFLYHMTLKEVDA
ncbi:MAG: hypothetical protein Q8M29_00700 [Bacteroidota bacterium]|nr:hypothetical protein [Bacteroidota bacterium]